MLQSIFGHRQPVVGRRDRVQVQNITAQELHRRLLGAEPPVLVDVRTPEEYELDGHIAGSRLLPLSTLVQRSQELPKERPIVCICRSGNRSGVACEQLASQGFSQVINLAGGMIGWYRAGLPNDPSQGADR
jgi:rhodanese-related sulfurtransferase